MMKAMMWFMAIWLLMVTIFCIDLETKFRDCFDTYQLQNK